MSSDTPPLPWHEISSRVERITFRLYSQHSMGTGFLFSCGPGPTGYSALLATAWHVVQEAREGMSLRICDCDGREVVRSKDSNMAVIEVSAKLDVAIVAILSKEELFPQTDLLPILPSGYLLRRGTKVGWLGYPGMFDPQLCFFSGHISGVIRNEYVGYLVDGVSIRGVSSGPVVDEAGQLVGVVSAYFYDHMQSKHVTLPGVSFMVPLQFIIEWAKNNLKVRMVKWQET